MTVGDAQVHMIRACKEPELIVVGVESGDLVVGSARSSNTCDPEDRRGFHGWCMILDVPRESAQAPPPACDFAGEGFESYVKAAVHPSAISTGCWHRLPRTPRNETPRSFKAWPPLFEASGCRWKAEKGRVESCWCT